jgi:hypothetical protein
MGERCNVKSSSRSVVFKLCSAILLGVYVEPNAIIILNYSLGKM